MNLKLVEANKNKHKPDTPKNVSNFTSDELSNFFINKTKTLISSTEPMI